MRIAVTGATGFIGAAIARHLRAREHEVTEFGRRPGVTFWDITKGRHEGAFDAVVHCAALADDTATMGDAMLVNRLGTRNVVASFPGARIVHLSTSSVYDAFTPTVHAVEGDGPATRFLSSYSESKAAAEAELPADAVILRPHAVYGPGDTMLLPRVLAGIRRRRLALPEGANVPHTLTHIDNLVQAADLALTGPAGVYNIGDDTDVLLSAVLRELLAKQGRADVRLTSIPYATALTLAGALEALQRRPRLTRYAVSQLGLERTLDLTAARRDLGYRPTPTTLAGAEEW